MKVVVVGRQLCVSEWDSAGRAVAQGALRARDRWGGAAWIWGSSAYVYWRRGLGKKGNWKEW